MGKVHRSPGYWCWALTAGGGFSPGVYILCGHWAPVKGVGGGSLTVSSNRNKIPQVTLITGLMQVTICQVVFVYDPICPVTGHMSPWWGPWFWCSCLDTRDNRHMYQDVHGDNSLGSDVLDYYWWSQRSLDDSLAATPQVCKWRHCILCLQLCKETVHVCTAWVAHGVSLAQIGCQSWLLRLTDLQQQSSQSGSNNHTMCILSKESISNYQSQITICHHNLSTAPPLTNQYSVSVSLSHTLQMRPMKTFHPTYSTLPVIYMCVCVCVCVCVCITVHCSHLWML